MVPRCVAGCVMATLGSDLLKDALCDARRRLDAFEYASVVIITVVIATQGFVMGITAGLVLACATFVIQASRSSVVKATFAGDNARSNTVYGSHQRRKLEKSKRKIQIIQLQGNVFFANIQQARMRAIH